MLFKNKRTKGFALFELMIVMVFMALTLSVLLVVSKKVVQAQQRESLFSALEVREIYYPLLVENEVVETMFNIVYDKTEQGTLQIERTIIDNDGYEYIIPNFTIILPEEYKHNSYFKIKHKDFMDKLPQYFKNININLINYPASKNKNNLTDLNDILHKIKDDYEMNVLGNVGMTPRKSRADRFLNPI